MPDSKITMIIPTMSRPELVNYALRYHENFPGKIIIADGSPEPCMPRFMPKNCVYFHEPLFWQRRNRRAVDMVDTPYTIFRADRRCVTNLGIAEGLRFLEDNPEYSAVDGTQALIYSNNKNAYEFKAAYPWDCLGEPEYSDDPAKRLTQIFSPAYRHVSFYALTRTEVWRDTVACYKDLMPNGALYELAQIMIMAAYGKFAVLPVIFSCILGDFSWKTHYYNPVLRDLPYDSLGTEQGEQFCKAITPFISRITGMDLHKSFRSVYDSLESFIANNLRRPKIKNDLQTYFKHLDDRSLSVMHEAGRLYALEICENKRFSAIFIGTWRRHSEEIFKELASRWRGIHTEYILAQDYSYPLDWHAPEAGIFDKITLLSSRLGEKGEAKEEVEAELCGLLEKSRPDIVFLLSEYLPIYELVENVCAKLGIKVCVLQNSLPGHERLPADILIAWDREWGGKFKLKAGCQILECGSLDYHEIVKKQGFSRVRSQTEKNNGEIVICIFLPDKKEDIRAFMEALDKTAELFSENCRFVIPVPPKGSDLPPELILSRNNIAYLPFLTDERALLKRIDIAIGAMSGTLVRAMMAGIPALALSEKERAFPEMPLAIYAGSADFEKALAGLSDKIRKEGLGRMEAEKLTPFIFYNPEMAAKDPIKEMGEKLFYSEAMKTGGKNA